MLLVLILATFRSYAGKRMTASSRTRFDLKIFCVFPKKWTPQKASFHVSFTRNVSTAIFIEGG